MDEIHQYLLNKKILITGCLGSIGSELLKQLADMENVSIIGIDNRETELHSIKKLYKPKNNVSINLCDIRDRDKMIEITKKVDVIIHAAALKHVVICELNPYEAVKTNIIGTQNLIESAIINDVEKFILISTDKAVNPTNMMGGTKLAAERLVAAYSNKDDIYTNFGIVRFGNVLSSRGSVLEIWKSSLSLKQKIPLTDINMTRFIMSIPNSVKLILKTILFAENGEIFILKMNSVEIINLAKAFLLANNEDENNFKIRYKTPIPHKTNLF